VSVTGSANGGAVGGRQPMAASHSSGNLPVPLNVTMLDRMPAGHAFLATTNLDLANLTERLQTRFLPVRLQPPDNEALAAFLARRWHVPIATTRMIAAGAAGNVRAAMADLEMWLG
jgi:hypothetical protein